MMKNRCPKAPKSSYRWFRNARYGMFIHYGLYSILGRREWVMLYERIPVEEYKKLAGKFNPEKLNLEDWVLLAKNSGMRYLCFTARHHEGFCLFDTVTTNFNSVKTVASRDFIREYTEACRKHGMGVGIYYSVADWTDPGFIAGPKKDPIAWRDFVNTVHMQLKELMTNYGRIDYLFYDGCPPPDTWGCGEINARIRSLQPHILISDRCGREEDVLSAEGHTISDPGRIWETCMSSNESWGYNYGDSYWKSAEQIVKVLMTCAHNGGNFLFNIGPRANGSVPAPSKRVLREVAEWLEDNGEAIYGTEPHPFGYAPMKLTTSRGNNAYIALQFYHGPETVVAGIGNKVKNISILTTGKSITFNQVGDRVFLIGLPKKRPDKLLTLLKFELDGKPQGIPDPRVDRARYE